MLLAIVNKLRDFPQIIEPESVGVEFDDVVDVFHNFQDIAQFIF